MAPHNLVLVEIGQKPITAEEKQDATTLVLRLGKRNHLARWSGDHSVTVNQLVSDGTTHRQPPSRALLVSEHARHQRQEGRDVVLAHRAVARLDSLLLFRKKGRVNHVYVPILHNLVVPLDRHIAPRVEGKHNAYSESPTFTLYSVTQSLSVERRRPILAVQPLRFESTVDSSTRRFSAADSARSICCRTSSLEKEFSRKNSDRKQFRTNEATS